MGVYFKSTMRETKRTRLCIVLFSVTCAGILSSMLLGFGKRSWLAALPPVSTVADRRYLTYCHEYGYQAWGISIGFGNAVVSLINMLHLSRQLGRTLLLPAYGFCYARFDLIFDLTKVP